MKPMNRRPSPILARVVLAAFLLTLPASREAFSSRDAGRGDARIGPTASAQLLRPPVCPAAITATVLATPSKASSPPTALSAPRSAESLNAPAASHAGSKSRRGCLRGNGPGREHVFRPSGAPAKRSQDIRPPSSQARGAAAPADVSVRKSRRSARGSASMTPRPTLFVKLIRAGYLAIRDNHDAVYFSFRARAEAAERIPAPERTADILAGKAVLLMNSSDSADHARAVAKADRAVTAYENIGLRTRKPLPQLEEARVLRANAMLEFLSYLLGAHKKELENRESQIGSSHV